MGKRSWCSPPTPHSHAFTDPLRCIGEVTQSHTPAGGGFRSHNARLRAALRTSVCCLECTAMWRRFASCCGTLRATLLFVHSLTATYTVLVAPLARRASHPCCCGNRGHSREGFDATWRFACYAPLLLRQQGPGCWSRPHTAARPLRGATHPCGDRAAWSEHGAPFPTQSPRKFKITIYIAKAFSGRSLKLIQQVY